MAKALKQAEGTATNGAAIATITGFSADKGGQLYVKGWILSASAAVAAAVVATLTGGDGGTIHINIPPGVVEPIIFMLPDAAAIRITPGVNAVLTLPALGAGVVGTATLFATAE